MEESVNVLVRSFKGKSKSLQKKYHSQTLRVNVKDVQKIRKDFNMVQLPFFYFGKLSKAKQYTRIIYDFEGEDAQMIVEASLGDVVPSQFDYDVVQVLLRFREAYKKDGRTDHRLEFSAWDVAKELGILLQNKNGKYGWTPKIKERISQSISRLVRTNYKIQNLYTVKNEHGERHLKDYVEFHIVNNLSAKDDFFGKDRLFSIKFNDFFVDAIDKGYKWDYELAKLEAISKSTARRLFEIIDTKRNSLQYYFSYDEVAWRIPLNSKRMNKICINGYLNHLKEVQAIHDYKVGYKLNQPDSDCFTVYFIKDTKARQDKLSSESDIDNTPLLKSIKTEVKEAKTHLPFAYDFLDAVLVRHGHEGYKDEVIKLFQQHDYNGDVFKSNLLRSLTKYDKNAGSFLGYLANSLKEDWAREDRIQEEAQQQAEQKILEAEQQNKQAETERQEAYQKEMQEFRKYFDSLPVAERERLWQQAESKVTFAPHNEELKKMVIFEEVKELVQAAKEAIPA